jgi:hypothetical protein
MSNPPRPESNTLLRRRRLGARAPTPPRRFARTPRSVPPPATACTPHPSPLQAWLSIADPKPHARIVPRHPSVGRTVAGDKELLMGREIRLPLALARVARFPANPRTTQRGLKDPLVLVGDINRD